MKILTWTSMAAIALALPLTACEKEQKPTEQKVAIENVESTDTAATEADAKPAERVSRPPIAITDRRFTVLDASTINLNGAANLEEALTALETFISAGEPGEGAQLRATAEEIDGTAYVNVVYHNIPDDSVLTENMRVDLDMSGATPVVVAAGERRRCRRGDDKGWVLGNCP